MKSYRIFSANNVETKETAAGISQCEHSNCAVMGCEAASSDASDFVYGEL